MMTLANGVNSMLRLLTQMMGEVLLIKLNIKYKDMTVKNLWNFLVHRKNFSVLIRRLEL
jgi:hypothetical protein